jgi:hypothetical protein
MPVRDPNDAAAEVVVLLQPNSASTAANIVPDPWNVGTETMVWLAVAAAVTRHPWASMAFRPAGVRPDGGRATASGEADR